MVTIPLSPYAADNVPDLGAEAGAHMVGMLSPAARAIVRGVRRRFAGLGYVSITELTLGNGRRADIAVLGPKGELGLIEVKSSVADFRADHKWADYQPFCDRFWFAVDDTFPLALLPDAVGILVADPYDAAERRPPIAAPLSGARRKAVLLRFAAAAAQRLHMIEDPRLGAG